MLFVGSRRGAVGDEVNGIVQHHGVARGRFAAHIGQRARDDQRIDAARPQLRIEIAGIADEGAVARLVDHQIPGLHIERGVDRMGRMPRRERHAHGVAHRWRHEGAEPQAPVALGPRGVPQPDHGAARGARLRGEAADVGDYRARQRHLADSTGLEKAGLHVHDHQRRLRRLDALEHVPPPAPGDQAVDDGLGDLDGMQRGLRNTTLMRRGIKS